MGIIERFAHLLRTDATYGYIELVKPVTPVAEPPIVLPHEMGLEHPARTAYTRLKCPHCGVRIAAPPSRIKHVYGSHVERCTEAGPASRRMYQEKGRWPGKRRVG